MDPDPHDAERAGLILLLTEKLVNWLIVES